MLQKKQQAVYFTQPERNHFCWRQHDLVPSQRLRAACTPRMVKWVLDRVIAVVLLSSFLPLLGLISLAIVCDTSGGALFKQMRQGLHGRIFWIYKFRTMHLGCCQDGSAGSLAQAVPKDPRVTRVGRWLRRTSLDELPQLINVLRGEMSLVGPRPHALAHDRFYAAQIPGYGLRYNVKPGITGLAQIEGLRGPTQTVELMARRVDRDLVYIADWSLRLDVWILLRTLATCLFHKGAC